MRRVGATAAAVLPFVLHGVALGAQPRTSRASDTADQVAVAAPLRDESVRTSSRLAASFAMSTGVGAAWVAEQRHALGAIARCIGAAGAADSIDLQPPPGADTLVVVQVAPLPAIGRTCVDGDGGGEARRALVVNGASDVDSVVVRARGRPMTPIAYRRVGVNGGDHAWHQVTVYLSARSFEPDTVGQLPAVDIVVRRRGADGTFEVPSAWMRAIWHRLLPARLARSATTSSSAVGSVAHLPEPQDAVLRALAAQDRRSGWASAVAARRALKTLAWSDSAFVALSLIDAMQETGDRAGQVAEARPLAAAHPCVVQAASKHWPRAVDLRAWVPRDRCSVVPISRLVFAAVFPGGGELLARRSWLGLAELGGVSLLVARAAATNARAVSTHGVYLASTDPTDARRSLLRANELRRLAGGQAWTAGTAWLATVVGSVVIERVHASRTARDRAYGSGIEVPTR